MKEGDKKLITLKELAAHFQVSPPAVSWWLKHTDIPAFQAVPRGKVLFHLPSVEKWMKRRKKAETGKPKPDAE